MMVITEDNELLFSVLLRPRLHEVRAIYRTHGIEFTLSYGCHILQHTSICSDSRIYWHLFNHSKGSYPCPITTSITHIISTNRLSNECITRWSHGTISTRTSVRDKLCQLLTQFYRVCRVSEASRTRLRKYFPANIFSRPPEQTFDKPLDR